MNREQKRHEDKRDPLGLRNLPLLEPDADGWAPIEQALRGQRRANRRRRTTAWLALAASTVLVVGLVIRQSGPVPVQEEDSLAARPTADAAPAAEENPVNELIAMSQMLERQLRGLRNESGPMPADSAVFVAELEDLVAQVDSELSYAPDSVNLWGQRVNLLLDLAQIYQQQWERQYGRMASL